MRLETEPGHQSPVSGPRMNPVAGLRSKNEPGRRSPVQERTRSPVSGLRSKKGVRFMSFLRSRQPHGYRRGAVFFFLAQQVVVADADDLGVDDLRRFDRLRPEQRYCAVYLYAVLMMQSTLIPI